MNKILIVDDEPAIVDMLDYNLRKVGHEPLVARDGPSALNLIRTQTPDLVILDLMLPGMDGLDICREVRKHSDLPIIMLTARDDEVDRVLGLELGADDYIVKPFSVRELMARVRTVLRRARPATSVTPQGKSSTGDVPPGQGLQVGDLQLDPSRHEVSWQGAPFELTAIQFDLLHLLMQHPGQVFTREELLNKVWGYDYYGDTRTVDSTIKRLRARLREVAPNNDLIVTVRDVGYKLA
jgi:DNA-binding response OmpR family regulator